MDFSRIDVSDNTQGVRLVESSGSLTNSTFDVKCNGIDTTSFKTTGTISHTLYVNDNTIETEEGAGITAYDGAIVVADRNTVSGASSGWNCSEIINNHSN